MKKNNLEELFLKEGTDKSEKGHGYSKYYEKHFNNTNIKKLLEIGVLDGASLRTWYKYFTKAEIHGVDIKYNDKLLSEFTQKGIICHEGSQIDISFLSKLPKDYDIIIDDGSHNSKDQVIAFLHMFENNLKQNGYYVIEDMHCCFMPFYWGRDIDRIEDTVIMLLKNIKNENKKYKNKYMDNNKYKYLLNNISEIDIYEDKIGFIKKI